MGAFSEQFKLSKRIRQADFGRQETREYWIAWANGIIDRVSPKKEQIVVKGTVDDRYYELPDGSKIPTITDSIELTKEEYDTKVERLKNL